MSSVKVFSQLLYALYKGDAVLATVVSIQGSVPREVSAKMVICADGEILNTIGGGAGEAKVCKQAQVVLATGEKQQVNIDLSGATHKQTEGVCGGLMDVWLEKWSGQKAIALVKEILNFLQLGQNVRLFTPFSPTSSPYLLKESTTKTTTEAGFLEVLTPPPLLLIIGAGHVGEQLAKIANMVGFQVMIQDDRPQWANQQRYPQAAQIFTTPISSVITQLANHSQLYIAMVTRGYQYDLEALRSIFENPIEIAYNYLGMIGSKKRINMLHRAIKELKIPSSTLDSIYAPIGLDIGALTPEEIAVSITAELILVQRGGTGIPLSQKL